MSNASPEPDEQHEPAESSAPADPSEPTEGGEAAGSSDPLRLVLHTMEEQLDDRVEAVSDARPARDESTAELIRLEETLSSAQDKAKQLVTLRLKLGEEQAAAAKSTDAASTQAASSEAATTDASPAHDRSRSKTGDAGPRPAQKPDT